MIQANQIVQRGMQDHRKLFCPIQGWILYIIFIAIDGLLADA